MAPSVAWFLYQGRCSKIRQVIKASCALMAGETLWGRVWYSTLGSVPVVWPILFLCWILSDCPTAESKNFPTTAGVCRVLFFFSRVIRSFKLLYRALVRRLTSRAHGARGERARPGVSWNDEGSAASPRSRQGAAASDKPSGEEVPDESAHRTPPPFALPSGNPALAPSGI